jgi:nitrous oxide reductase accessory protein NosL
MTMRTLVKTAVIVISIIVFGAISVVAETVRCAECGMMVDMNSKFSARATQGKTISHFCDIGDLLIYLKKTKSADVLAEVKDYTTGTWIDARKAVYVRAEKKFHTPMGWGIAAFTDTKQASEHGQTLDLTTALKGLK